MIFGGRNLGLEIMAHTPRQDLLVEARELVPIYIQFC